MDGRILKQLTVSMEAFWLFVTSHSPSDITCSLLISLDVSHGAIPVAKRFNSHQIIAAVTCLPVFVEMGERRHNVRQRAEVTLRWVFLLNGWQSWWEMVKNWSCLNVLALAWKPSLQVVILRLETVQLISLLLKKREEKSEALRY